MGYGLMVLTMLKMNLYGLLWFYMVIFFRGSSMASWEIPEPSGS